MKQIIFSFYLLLGISFNSFSQSNTSPAADLISFKLKNNSLLPSKVTVISYRPDETGNGTSGSMFLPYASKTFSFPVGTKIYLATGDQVNTVMSGSRISDQPPYLLVKKADEGKSFNIK